MKYKIYILFSFALLFSTHILSAQVPTACETCTNYASPTGTGSTCTIGTPCLITTFLNSATLRVPGAVLCLNDGTYTGSSSFVTVPTAFAGTESQPICIRALNEGQATISAGPNSRPVNILGTRGILWGFNAKGGDNSTLSLGNSSSFWQIKRMVIKGEGDPDNMISIQGDDHLIDEVAGYGVARYTIAAHTANNLRNTIRNSWFRWENNQFLASNPTSTILMGYGADQLTFENTITNWSTAPSGRVTSPEAVGSLWRTQNSKWLGSIFYVLATDTFNPPRVFGGTVDAGSQAQAGNFHPTTGLLWKHNVAYIDPSHPLFGSKQAIAFSECSEPGCLAGSGNNIQDSVGVGGVASTFSSSWTVSNMQLSTVSLEDAIGAGNSLWTDSNPAPGICKKYIGGVLTNEPMWPWSMNQRLIDFMTAEGDTPVDVTATMESLFGTIPEICKTAGEPPAPPSGGATNETTVVRSLFLMD